MQESISSFINIWYKFIVVHVVTVISSIFILARVWIPGGSSIWRFCVIVSFRGLEGIAFVHLVAWAAHMCQRGWKGKTYNYWNFLSHLMIKDILCCRFFVSVFFLVLFCLVFVFVFLEGGGLFCFVFFFLVEGPKNLISRRKTRKLMLKKMFLLVYMLAIYWILLTFFWNKLHLILSGGQISELILNIKSTRCVSANL